jgi:predicted lipoprotein with Yx(FWY)xxD motif
MVHLRAVIVAMVVTLGACGAPAGTDAADDAEASAVAVTSSSLGEILVDGEGKTLYLFLSDEQGGPSTCSGDCEETWPPLAGPAAAAEGADEALLSTVEREGGTQQATYNGWPLYYFAADTAAGNTNGQGVGDVWFALDARGEAVKAAAADKPQGGRDY